MKHNTTERVFSTAGRSVQRSMAIALALLLCANALSSLYLSRFTPNATYWLLQTKWRALQNGPAVDWLILGDSLGNQGLDAALVATHLGRTYNYCTIANALVLNDADMLRYYLARHGPPKGVLIVHTHDVWYRQPHARVVARVPPSLWRLPAYGARNGRRLVFVAAALADRWWPLWFQGASLKETVLAPSQLFTARLPLDEYGTQVERRPNPGALKEDLKRQLEFARESRFSVSESNRNGLAELCRMADNGGFDLYFTMCPIYSEAIGDPAFSRYYRDVLHYLHDVERSNPRFRVLWPFPITEVASRMQSVDHVTYPAAKDFTRTVIQRIQRIRSE